MSKKNNCKWVKIPAEYGHYYVTCMHPVIEVPTGEIRYTNLDYAYGRYSRAKECAWDRCGFIADSLYTHIANFMRELLPDANVHYDIGIRSKNTCIFTFTCNVYCYTCEGHRYNIAYLDITPSSSNLYIDHMYEDYFELAD